MHDQPTTDGKPELTARKIASGDPILARLTGSPVSPITIGIVCSLVFFLARMLAARQAGCLVGQGNMVGFLNDPAMYTNVFYAAAIIAAYVWVPRGIAAVIAGLYRNNVIQKPTEETYEKRGDDYTYAHFITQMADTFGKRHWFFLAAAASVVALGLFLPWATRLLERQDVCAAVDALNLGLTLLWVMTMIYAFGTGFIYCLLCIYWLNKLFRSFTIHVRPLHPDRAGGLFPLGNFALRLSYLATLIGFMPVLSTITRHYVLNRTFGFALEPDIVAGLALYVVAAPIVFFAPLATAHRSMRDAKNQFLLDIDEAFADEYHDVRQSLKEAPADLKERLERFKELQELHDMVRKFPVWPFNADNLRRFGTSWMSPIILGLLVEIAARILG